MKAVARFISSVCVIMLASAIVRAEPKDTDRFRFTTDVRVEYTDNRDAVKDTPGNNAAGLYQEETWDFYLKLKPAVYLDTDRFLLDFYVAPSIRYRTNPNPFQNDFEPQLDMGLGARYNVSRILMIKASDKLDYIDDPSQAPAGTDRGDLSYLINRTDGSLVFELGRLSELELGGGYGLKRYIESWSFGESPASDYFDEDRADVDGTYRLNVTKMVALQVMGQYSWFSLNSPDFDRDFNSVLGAAGTEVTFTSRLRAGLMAGAQGQFYADPSLSDSVSPYGEIWIRGATIPALRLNGGITHAVRDSDFYPYSSQEYTDFRAGVAWDATPFITLGVDGTYRLASYDDVRPEALNPGAGIYADSGDARIVDVVGRIAFNFTAKSSLQLAQRYENRDSDLDWIDGLGRARTSDFDKNTTTLVYSQQF
jgi:hypothetical protein